MFMQEVVLRESSDNDDGLYKGEGNDLDIIKIIKSKLRRMFKLYGVKPYTVAFHRTIALQFSFETSRK